MKFSQFEMYKIFLISLEPYHNIEYKYRYNLCNFQESLLKNYSYL